MRQHYLFNLIIVHIIVSIVPQSNGSHFASTSTSTSTYFVGLDCSSKMCDVSRSHIHRIGTVPTSFTVLHHVLCRHSTQADVKFHIINVYWIVVTLRSTTQKWLMFLCRFLLVLLPICYSNEWKLSSYAANLLMSFAVTIEHHLEEKVEHNNCFSL